MEIGCGASLPVVCQALQAKNLILNLTICMVFLSSHFVEGGIAPSPLTTDYNPNPDCYEL